MDRRYRRRNNSITSIVSDVVQTASKLPWWGALLTGFLAYVLVSIILGGYIESHIAAQEGSKFYPILQVRFGRLVQVCEWVGIACILAGIFFAVRNYYVSPRAARTEKSAVTIISKMLGRSLD
ncbi:MAG: hypothetical protein OQK12_08430 [Motiliproteus sp.]|nr:hypothetical protein [Motiliproteus sp.]MCW9053251.1 hypothetical protein [Motiliproteus sp.]